jgi:hypothetical protein
MPSALDPLRWVGSMGEPRVEVSLSTSLHEPAATTGGLIRRSRGAEILTIS